MTVIEATPSTLSVIRQSVAAAITSTPTYPVPPDDVAHLPCAVVSPLSMTRREASSGGLWGVEVDVIVLGRRYDDAGSAFELDDLVWLVVAELDDARPLELASPLRPNSIIPSTVSVAGLDHPAYSITVASSAIYC